MEIFAYRLTALRQEKNISQQQDDLGVKQETSAPHPAIREEQVLMKHYRQLAPEDKAAVSRLLASLASRK